MSNTAQKRLLRDFKRIQEDPPVGISGSPTENIMTWKAVIYGTDDTYYEGGCFKLILMFPDEYPLKPPLVKFTSKMFHPNVYTNGDVCLDILQSRWSPTYDVSAILLSIQSIFGDPNPYSPANFIAAQLYRENRHEYVKQVKACVDASLAD